MAKDIKQYVATCTTCQTIKPARHKSYGELTSLPDAEGPWLHFTIDFITGLPPSVRKRRAYDSILVIVDRYTKWSRYIPVSISIKADELAEILIRSHSAWVAGTLSPLSRIGDPYPQPSSGRLCGTI